MFKRENRKRLPLKTVYYLSYILFIVIPILVVLIIALMILNQIFTKQSIENIKRSQETIIADLASDEDVMSMRLSHLIYTNNNEVLEYAAGTDSTDQSNRNSYEKKLYKSVKLALEPVKEIISVNFFMKSGKETYIEYKLRPKREEVIETRWYQTALEKKNRVSLGYYNTKYTNDLYMGSKKDSLVLIYALAPDVTTDRTQKIEMVMYYQATSASDRIKVNNQAYLAGKNKLGITQIKDSEGELVYSIQNELDYTSHEYSCIRTPIYFNNTTWYIENYIKTSDLTADFWNTAFLVLGAAILVLLLSGYYSQYFLRSIIKPIEEISNGLKLVEEGNLDVHITSKGQFEIRTLIHQFNAMARRLKALVNEYEARINLINKKPEDYFAAMVKGEMTPEETNKKSKEFFQDNYALLGFYVEDNHSTERDGSFAVKVISSFERNPRFAARCIIYNESDSFFLVYYRIIEKEYLSKLVSMVEELQRLAHQELDSNISVCIGENKKGYQDFEYQLKQIREKIQLRYLYGKQSIINLSENKELLQGLFWLVPSYEKLASALYVADEKNMTEEKDKLFALFGNKNLEEIRFQIYGVILAITQRFDNDNSNYLEVFGNQNYDYIHKISRIDDVRSIKLWVTNYFAWIIDYSATRLNINNTDAIVKAKRYIADNYDDADLNLTKVAEFVGLNEKYFTSRFSKETGEKFTNYLTEFRMQKARDLLKNTNFKVYEIAEMVGYYNVEHFNRMFKRLNDITPSNFRKLD